MAEEWKIGRVSVYPHCTDAEAAGEFIDSPTMNSTPASLLERLRRPSASEPWERFVKLLTPVLFLGAQRMGFGAKEAAELAQQSLLEIYRRLPEFGEEHPQTFRQWLQLILLNQGHSRQRPFKPTTKGQGPGTLQPNDLLFTATEFRRNLVGRALELMEPEFQARDWKVFQAYALDGKPAARVAAEAGVSPGTVRAVKFRVLYRLRQELSGLLD
jgi:RNA polymerase sigma-70 factor (ECF subfamily)